MNFAIDAPMAGSSYVFIYYLFIYGLLSVIYYLTTIIQIIQIEPASTARHMDGARANARPPLNAPLKLFSWHAARCARCSPASIRTCSSRAIVATGSVVLGFGCLFWASAHFTESRGVIEGIYIYNNIKNTLKHIKTICKPHF